MNRSLLFTAIGLTILTLNCSLAQTPNTPRPDPKPKPKPGPRVPLPPELLQSIESHEGLTYLDANDPPALILSGEFDGPSTHADTFRAKMKTLGLPTGYVPVPGAPHGFINQQKHFDFSIERITNFFGKHLGGTSSK